MKKNIILGITGTLGAGKGTIASYLKRKGFTHYSVRNFLIKEIKKRGMPINRKSMAIVGNELRKKNSPSFLVEQLYKQAKKEGGNCIIESIRTEGEIRALRKKGRFYLLAVDADPKIRYERIIKRGSETDNVSYKEFLENEQKEMVSNDPAKQNINKCIKMADYKILNNGSFNELYQKIEVFLNKIAK